MTAPKVESFEIGGVTIRGGTRQRIEIPVAKLFDYSDVSMPVEVIRGKKPGPVLFVSAAIHGDELNGVEVARRLLRYKRIGVKMAGTLIVVPVVNVFGFNRNSRYLPDRRDLNRCFPGSQNGSVGGQIARVFMREIVEKSTHGVDLHTAAIHRTNLPQVRACLDTAETLHLAHAFGVPVALNSNTRDGSLRQAAAERGIPMILFEGGEALRHDEKVIQTAFFGVIAVMESIGMLRQSNSSRSRLSKEQSVARSSHWTRAPHSGSLHVLAKLGQSVTKGDLLGEISNPYGDLQVPVHAQCSGIVIGMTMIPLVNNGDAVFHIAIFDDAEGVEEQLSDFDDYLEDELSE